MVGRRTGTDFETGLYTIRTIKPGAWSVARAAKPWRRTSTSGSPPAASISASPRACISSDEEAANAQDPVLNIIEQPERRKTLIAPRSVRDGATVYTFDIHLQGERETVFFDA